MQKCLLKKADRMANSADPDQAAPIIWEQPDLGLHCLSISVRKLRTITVIFSSPEPLGSKGELIVYPSSRRPSSSVGPSVHHFQRSSPLKPLDQSKPNFMWSLLGKGERKFI